MTIIGRILIILAAAMVIVGATLAITYNSSPTQFATSAPGGDAFRPGGDRLGGVNVDESFVPDQRPEGFDGGSLADRNQIRRGSFISAQLIRHLAVIAGSVVLVTLVEGVLKIRRPGRAG
jgi:hypothetical protein